METLLPTLDNLPSETLCQILSSINDYNTIKSIVLSGNQRLIELTFRCVTKLSGSGSLSLNIVKQFANLESLYVTVPLNTLDDVKTIASLPKLRNANLFTPQVRNYLEFFEIIKTFVTQYCQGSYNIIDSSGNLETRKNNRDLSDKRFTYNLKFYL